MKEIKRLSDRIKEEIADAKTYAEWALMDKDKRPEDAKRYFTISTQEMEHMKTLHDIVVEMIAEYRKLHGEPPSDMQAIYDYLHKEHIEAAGEVKALQMLFKE